MLIGGNTSDKTENEGKLLCKLDAINLKGVFLQVTEALSPFTFFSSKESFSMCFKITWPGGLEMVTTPPSGRVYCWSVKSSADRMWDLSSWYRISRERRATSH